MELDFAVIADGVSVRPDGKFDIFGAGLNTVNTRGVPATHPRLVVVARVLVTEADVRQPHTVTAAFRSPDSIEIASARSEIAELPDDAPQAFEDGSYSLVLIMNFDNVVFPQFGPYQLALLWDETEMRSPLLLRVVEYNG